MKNNYQLQLEEFLEIVGKNNASDLHLSVGKKPAIRVDGELIELVKYPILSGEHATGLIYALLTEEQKQKLFTDKEIDLSYDFNGKARFRITIKKKPDTELMFFFKEDIFRLLCVFCLPK